MVIGNGYPVVIHQHGQLFFLLVFECTMDYLQVFYESPFMIYAGLPVEPFRNHLIVRQRVEHCICVGLTPRCIDVYCKELGDRPQELSDVWPKFHINGTVVNLGSEMAYDESDIVGVRGGFFSPRKNHRFV